MSLEAKERRFGDDSGQKYEDLVQKYEATTTTLLLLLLLLRQAAYLVYF